MDSGGNGFLKEVRVHLFDLFIKKSSSLCHLHNGERLSQLNLNSLHLEGVIKLFQKTQDEDWMARELGWSKPSTVVEGKEE